MIEWLYRQKRSFLKAINSIYFQYANNRYAIAFRERNGKALYEEGCSGAGFILINNSIRYWRADPFIFKYQEKNYIFAELFDKYKSKGVIGYAEINGARCGKFHICLEEDYHLSYPCVFQYRKEIFMVPETKENNAVTIYKAVDFPNQWEKEQVLCELPCVDTTPFSVEGENYYFTTIANIHSTDDNLFVIHERTGTIKKLISNSLCVRSAGQVIQQGHGWIRPSQDDTTYGDAVILNKIESFCMEDYREYPYKRILPPGDSNNQTICISLKNNRKQIKFNGLHTYNVNSDYEVIDLRYPRLSKKKL